jgi:hypothetical protein
MASSLPALGRQELLRGFAVPSRISESVEAEGSSYGAKCCAGVLEVGLDSPGTWLGADDGGAGTCGGRRRRERSADGRGRKSGFCGGHDQAERSGFDQRVGFSGRRPPHLLCECDCGYDHAGRLWGSWGLAGPIGLARVGVDGVGEVLGFVDYFAVVELHDAVGEGGAVLVGDGVFGDPEIGVAEGAAWDR